MSGEQLSVGELWPAAPGLPPPQSPVDSFDPVMIDHLPEPARRWLIHSITPGTRLAVAAQLSMHGTIRIGAWRRFTAHQVIRPDTGFVWRARSRIAGLPIRGFDRYVNGTGEMRWRLAGLIPVMSTRGPDVTRSAAARLAGESVFVPTSLVTAHWQAAGDDSATENSSARTSTRPHSAEQTLAPIGTEWHPRLLTAAHGRAFSQTQPVGSSPAARNALS